MATIKSIIRKDQPDSKGECRIILLYRNGTGPALKISIGEKVNPLYFDDSTGRVFKHPRSKEINRLIDISIGHINDIVFDLKRLKLIPSTGEVKKRYHAHNLKSKKEHVISIPSDNNLNKGVYDCWQELMELKKNTVRKNTISIYATTLDHLINYCSNRDIKLTWDLFTVDFNTYWINYFLDECKNPNGGIGLTNNTIGKYIKTLKQFLNWSVLRGYHKGNEYKNYKIFAERGDIFPLNESHIAKLIAFSENEKNSLRLRRTSSLFVFLCSTGLRYNDAQSIRLHDLHYLGSGDATHQVIKVRASKTGDKLIVALNSYSIDELIRNANWNSNNELIKFLTHRNVIFDKGEAGDLLLGIEDHSIALLPQLSLVKFNEYIKEVGKQCGFNENIVITRNKGNENGKHVFQRWEKLSSHDGRRTFITLNLEKGMRPEVLMEFTGHKSYKTMLAYNKILESKKIEEFHKIWGDEKQVWNPELGILKVGKLTPKKND
jgi:site-specific recombinase XerD